MLPTEGHTAMTDAPGVERRLLTGDLGVVVLRALLENGVGYIVSSWRDQPTPIDAAIDAARDRVLTRRGVVLRRLRSLAAIEPIIAAPTGGVTGQPPRGAVVFAGRRGLRPALEQFVRIPTSGAVVGLCFDEDAVRIDDAIVVDPEPTAAGLARAIDQAFEASLLAGRPALVVLRPRTLGMRGTIRIRLERSPDEAARADAAVRTAPVDAATAAVEAGLVDAAAGHGALPGPVVVAAGPLRVAIERALARIGQQLALAGVEPQLEDVSIVAQRACGIVPPAASPHGRLVAAADGVCVVAGAPQRVADRLRAVLGVHAEHLVAIEPGSVRAEQLERGLAEWLVARCDETEVVRRAALEALVASNDATDVASRVPRRDDVLHRGVSATVAAGLTLAQGVIGVPGRIDPAWPTYRTDTGVPLTVAPAQAFAEHGISAAAPDSGTGVVVAIGSAPGVMEAAGAAGASIEHVDGSSPRAIGVAVARACAGPRAGWHVICVSDVQRVAALRAAVFGMDPELVGTERIATAAVPTSATVLVTLDDELVDGPSVIALDRPEAHAALDQVRELSPATWDLRARRADGRLGRLGWNLRRRAVRSIAGVEL